MKNKGHIVVRRPKVGLLMFMARWFSEVGVGSGRYKKLPQIVKEDAKKIVDILQRQLEVVNPGVIDSVDKAVQAAKKVADKKVDLVIICHIMWSEDQPVIRALQEIGQIPVVIWCYSPYKELPSKMTVADLFRVSGAVGTVQASAPLRKMGFKSGFVLGHPSDKELIKNILEYAEAAKMAKELKNVTVGLLPSRCEAITGTYTDEFRLMEQIGPKIKYISVRELSSASEDIEESVIKAYIKGLKNKYEICNVSDKSLFQAARVSLGLGKIAEKFNLDGIALNDLDEELHKVIGLRPCLYVPEIFEKGRVVGMEGEICGTIALLILQRLSGKIPMYTEIFTYDKKNNTVLAGHAGMHDIRLAGNKVRIVPDYEYCESGGLEGAWMEFKAKPGRVTMLSLFSDVDNFKMVIAQGEALPGPGRLEGFPHMLIKLDIPVSDFFRQLVNTGMTQHWAVVHDDLRGKVEKLSDLLGLKKVIMAQQCPLSSPTQPGEL